jgi:hypothetical protein
MLSIYSNQQEVINSTNTIRLNRLDTVDSELLKLQDYSLSLKATKTPCLEFHVYSPDGTYLTGKHKTAYTLNANSTKYSEAAASILSVDLLAELKSLGIQRGQYKGIFNVFDNVLGSYEGQKLYIKEISPSRKELRIFVSNVDSVEIQNQLQLLQEYLQSTSEDSLFRNLVLNFGFNENYQIINIRIENLGSSNPEIYVKLYSALPNKHIEKSKIWISEELVQSIAESIILVPKHVTVTSNKLAGPNFSLEATEGISVATGYKNWGDLISSNLQTSQQIIDSQFSGSLSGIKLNINYSIFDSFVHYSSAEERVNNFKYKMELIETYSDTIKRLTQIPGRSADTNLEAAYKTRNGVVSAFDDFEKYLFFETTNSTLYTNYDISSGSLTSGSISPWPKNNSKSNYTWLEAYSLWSSSENLWNSDPYNYFASQAKTTSVEANIYFNDLITKAQLYDKANLHSLQNNLPTYIKDSSEDEYVLFINMIGQHFDILWTYIKNLTSIHTREEHPKDGMPSDLLYQVAQSMGFNLLNGKSASELWNYSLNNQESTLTISDSDNTKEIWRRIVNNLPYILKTKGTSRSVKALLACFGIPSTLLTIKEYGGPSTFTDNTHYPEYVHDEYFDAWLSTSSSFSVPESYGTEDLPVLATAVEFRFKTDDNFTYSPGTTYSIFSIDGSGGLTLTKQDATSNLGTLNFKNPSDFTSMSISNLEIFDNSWHTIQISETGNASYYPYTASLYAAKSLYGKNIYVKSSSYRYPDPFRPASLILGQAPFFFADSTVTGAERIKGHFQEIRIWSGSLNEDTLIEHSLSPNSYTYNVDRFNLSTGQEAAAPYDRLIRRYVLSKKTLKLDSGSGLHVIPSNHPNTNLPITGNAFFFQLTDSTSSSIKFETFEDTYYTPSPSLGGNTLYTNKIRIESSSLQLNKRLNTKTRIEKSSFDRYSIDSNKVGVYFSPQTAINEDIFNQLGYFEIDDYIGNPSDNYESSYSDLNNFAVQYWKKYELRNDFEAYFRALRIFDFTLFKYIKRLLPAHSNAIVGLTLEPNVLERSKFKLLNKPTIDNLVKEVVLNGITDNLKGAYTYIQANVANISQSIVSNEIHSLEALIENTATLSSDLVNISPGIVANDISVADKLGTQWLEHKYVANKRVLFSGSLNTPVSASFQFLQTIIDHSRPSTYLQCIDQYFYSTSLSASMGLAYSSSLKFAEVDNFHGTGYRNARFNGSKLSGPGINVSTPNTVDGRPVVEVTKVNGNQIVFSDKQLTTIDKPSGGKLKGPTRQG